MWKSWIQQPINTAQDAQAWVEQATRSGRASVRAMLGGLPFCASLTSSQCEQETERQEDLIHYFLIPSASKTSVYVLFSKHQLPAGIGTENDLDKFSVFHLPHEGAEDKLEELVLGHLTASAATGKDDAQETLDRRLERVAREIEKQSYYVTGGILVIGGLVACANPLLGVGIAAKALFPSVGAKLSSEAMKLGGGRLRKFREAGEQKSAKKSARSMLKQRKTRLVVNPFLQKLQLALDTDEKRYDPAFEDPFLRDASEFPAGLRAVTLEVLSEHYTQLESIGGEKLGPEDHRWFQMLRELVRLEQQP